MPRMFQGFPEIKEALIANKMQAAFIVAPLAIALAAAGRADQDRLPRPPLRQRRRRPEGRTRSRRSPICAASIVAIPSRFSDERLILFKRHEGVRDQADGDIKMVEMAPPDVAGALAARRDRRLLHGRAVSLAGRDGRIRPRPVPRAGVLAGLHVVRAGRAAGLIDHAARGRAGAGRRHRALGLVARTGQAAIATMPPISSGASTTTRSPRCSSGRSPSRSTGSCTSPLAPRKPDFDLVRDLMIETGVLDKKIDFEDYTDTRFADRASIETAWKYEPGTATAK